MARENLPLADISPLACCLFGTTFLTVGICNTQAFIKGDWYFYPMMLMVGGFGQLLPGLVDMLKNETFGGVALTAFGIFWITEGLWSIPWPEAAVATSFDANDLSKVFGFYRLGWFITITMFAIAAFKISKVHGLLVSTIDFCVLILVINSFIDVSNQKIGSQIFGYFQILAAIIGYYTGIAVFFKALKVTNLPMGYTNVHSEPVNPHESAAYRRQRLSGEAAFP